MPDSSADPLALLLGIESHKFQLLTRKEVIGLSHPNSREVDSAYLMMQPPNGSFSVIVEYFEFLPPG